MVWKTNSRMVAYEPTGCGSANNSSKLVEVLEELWPIWTAPRNTPTKYRRPSGPEKTGQKHFLATMRAHEAALVKLNRNAGEHTCFAWKQKTRYGPLYPVTAQQAKQVAMWGTPIDSMKWRDFLLMSEFVLQLPNSASHAGIGEIREVVLIKMLYKNTLTCRHLPTPING